MKIKEIIVFCLSSFVLFSSCSTSGTGGLFSKKTQREKYEEKVKEDSGANHPLVNKWLNAGEYSLNHPLGVSNIYSESGRFVKENQTATSLVAELKRGQKLTVRFKRSDTAFFKVYMDLWHAGDSVLNREPSFISAADTALNYLEYTAMKDEKLLVRFQQAINAAGGYELLMQTGPSLGFPIAAKVKSNIGSLWGAGRDGGARSHEGIDIFAPKHSPAIAVAEGTVTSVSENNLGGKVVFMQPKGMPFNVYYAHLDSQLVNEGDHVYAGDVLGLTGNTGNAKYTASHLHFGIYTYGGAIDPLLFVKPVKFSEKKSPAPSGTSMQTSKATKFFTDISSLNNFSNTAKNLPVTVEAITGIYYRVVLADGRKGFLPMSAVKKA